MLTYTWEHTVSIAVLDTIGLLINIWFLFTIKKRESPYNAIDVLQGMKTVSCLIALVICVWLEVATCSTVICTATKGIADDLFIYSTCYAFLAIAYIRRKVCMCRGRASVLITNRYAIKTMFICFTPVGMFVAANMTLMSGDQRSPPTSELVSNDTNEATDSVLLVGYSKMAYELCHILILVILPLSVSTALYVKIIFAISRTAQRMGGSMTQRTRDPSKMIMASVILLLFTVLSVWGVFVIVKIVSLLLSIDDVFFLYWKIVILIAQPIGDGLLQQSKRKKGNGGHAVPGRSDRRVYPWRTPSQSVSPTENSYENISLAEKLPVLIEETTLHTSNEHGENGSELEDSKPGYLIKKRRQSIMHHPRTSVLVRNAAVIGLEFQEKTSLADFGRQRKASQEKLKAELENIESAAINRQRTRRLSNCLRFSVVDEPSDDEVYHIYKELYYRRGSKYSEKSNRSGHDQDSMPGFKTLSNASVRSGDKDRKISDASSGCLNSPSQKRWKRLFTTARSANRFSEMRKHNTGIVIEEEAAARDSPIRQTRGNLSTPQGKLSAFSLAQHAKYANSTPLRRSLDDRLSSNGKKEEKIHRNKKRSISCVSNDWAKANNSGGKSRKHSVTFVSNSKLDAPSTSHHINRSISYDTQIYLDYMQDDKKKNKKHDTRYSHGDVRSQRPSNNTTTKVQRWLCKDTSSRDECIAHLMEMKEYF